MGYEQLIFKGSQMILLGAGLGASVGCCWRWTYDGLRGRGFFYIADGGQTGYWRGKAASALAMLACVFWQAANFTFG